MLCVQILTVSQFFTVCVLAAPGSDDVPQLPPADHPGRPATDSLCGSHH